MTLPETRLWKVLRGTPLHVRRQAPIGRYIADFAIHDCKLVIEVDGLRHTLDEEMLNDCERDAWFVSQGYRTLRFTNERVLGDIEGVLADIQAAVQSPPSPTLPPSRGKGG
jgi:very-short-patch-repair endonuclease